MQTVELYIDLSMARKSEKEKCSAFLYVIGQKGRDVYNVMNLDESQRDKIDVLFNKFEEYCKPKQNVTVERYHFNTRVQDKGEQIDRYITDLRLIAKNCSFGELEHELIRDRVVCGINSDDVKQQLLRVQDLTLDKTLTICRAYEQSKKHIQYLSEETNIEHVHRINPQKKYSRPQTQKSQNSNRSVRETEGQKQHPICDNCGLQHARKQCPAYGKQCRKCGKLNHFQKWCRSKKKVNAIAQDTNSDDELFIGALTKHATTEIKSNECFVTLEIQGATIRFKVDTGSQANIMPTSKFELLKPRPSIEKTSTRLISYTGEDLPVCGQFTLQYQSKSLEFFVVETQQDSVLEHLKI